MKKYSALLILWIILMGNLPAQAQTISMRIPDTTGMSGNNIDIPVYADNTLTGNNVFSYLLQLSFNASYLQVVSVITTGTISAPYGSPAVNTSVPGQVTLAGAGTTALTGSGKFIYVRFKSLQPGFIGVSFTGAQSNYFNEGSPVMLFHNGSMNITPPPFITVSPNTGTITKSETLQFSVSGGTAPYQWFVTNPTVASISTSGLLTGTLAGFTKVVAVDNVGLRDTTNAQIEIRAMRLSVPGGLSQWQGSDIDIPVNTTTLDGLNIFSGSFSIDFNQNILAPVGIVQPGTLLASYPVPVFNKNVPGTVSIDFAGTTPLTGSGALIYVKFHVSTQYTGSTALNLSNGLFNESLVPNFTNGSFTTINLPILSITPNTGTLVAGQTNQFTLNGGGTPPIVWSVSSPSVGSISQSGLVSTTTGGNFTVTATDSHGATATTGNWLVYDTRVIMPDTTACPAALEFYYPVRITALPAGESVNSVQATIAYNTTYLTFQNVEQAGTLTQGWNFVTNPGAGQVILAGSGATAFNTPGNIVKLKFLLKPAFVLGTNAALQLNAITLNEGSPNPLTDVNGYILGANSPVSVYVSASVNPVYPGNPVTFTASPFNGGTAPAYQWKVNNTSVPGATNATCTYIPVNADAVSCLLTSNSPCTTGSTTVASNIVTMTVTNLPVNNAVYGNIAGSQSKCYNATSIITVAGGGNTFTVQNGGYVTMIAGQSIDFLPGSKVFAGGYLHGYIAPAGPFCLAPPVPAAAMGSIEIPEGGQKPFFTVYPNPTAGEFTLELDHDVAAGHVNIEIFGMQGDRISSAQLNGETMHGFSLAGKPDGLYFIRVITGYHTEIKKIIKH